MKRNALGVLFFVVFAFLGLPSNVPAANTIAVPSPGAYLGAQDVMLLPNAPATVYCTTNGAVPQIGDADKCMGPVRIRSSATLQFFSVDETGFIESTQITNYIITGGTMRAWGANANVQLGDGTALDQPSPVRVSTLSDVVSFAAGKTHSAGLKRDGTVWVWGDTMYDPYLYGSPTRTTPFQVSELSDVMAVSAGYRHTQALKRDGTVWAWGSNSSGVVGDGTTIDRWEPVQVQGLTDVAAISAGELHAVALKKDGTVWTWGDNQYGQIGDGWTDPRPVPVQVLTDVMAIAAGAHNTYALKRDGTVWAWGANNHYQIGDNTTYERHSPVQAGNMPQQVISISAGTDYVSVLRWLDATAWSWGRNDAGQLGDGTTTDGMSPVQAAGMADVRSISAGASHALAVKQDGSVWAWGSNATGQLGDDSTSPSLLPVQSGLSNAAAVSAGFGHSLALEHPGSLAVTTPALATGYTGTSYSQTLAATGGQTPYTWFITSGALPSGLSLNGSTGLISGIPQAAGTSIFTVRVTDANSQTNSKVLSIVVSDYLPLNITTWTLPGGLVGRTYSATLAVSGGVAPFTWRNLSSLPQGLSLNSATGVISGIPTTTGSTIFTVEVMDAIAQTSRRSLTIQIYADNPLVIITDSLPNGVVGYGYSKMLSASGGLSPYTWSVASGSLPPGILLYSSSGQLYSTPTQAGTWNFTIQVMDALSQTVTRDFSIFVYTSPVITTGTLPNGSVGGSYSQTLTGTGGLSPYTWSISAGSLPAGLSLDSSTGVISGTPTTVGTSTFTVLLTDSNARINGKQFSITITSSPVITTSSLPNGTSGTAYSQTLAATGGVAPYTWSITSGSLPAGLSLNTSTGVIAGTPSTAGTSSFTVRVTDANSLTDSRTLSITINAPLTIATSSLPGGVTGISYSQTLAASGGQTPYTWSITSGNLPEGLSLDTSTGVISGTPATAGTSSFTAQVADANLLTNSRTLSITIYGPLAITSSSLPDGATDVAYSQTLAATGGATPYTWSITSGSLPAGLSLNSSTGVISGTPTTAGTSSFTVQVADAALQTDSRTLSITVIASLTITSTALPNGVKGKAYSQTLTASGGFPPYTWSIVSGSLPAGLSLNGTTGVISGTPTKLGTFSFEVAVQDAVSGESIKTLSIGIKSR